MKLDAQANALTAAKSLLSKTMVRVRELEAVVQATSSSSSSSSHTSVAPSSAPRLKRARSPETPGLRVTSARSSYSKVTPGD